MIQYIDATTGEVLERPNRPLLVEYKDAPRHTDAELTRLKLARMGNATTRQTTHRRARKRNNSQDTLLAVIVLVVVLAALTA